MAHPLQLGAGEAMKVDMPLLESHISKPDKFWGTQHCQAMPPKESYIEKRWVVAQIEMMELSHLLQTECVPSHQPCRGKI